MAEHQASLNSAHLAYEIVLFFSLLRPLTCEKAGIAVFFLILQPQKFRTFYAKASSLHPPFASNACFGRRTCAAAYGRCDRREDKGTIVVRLRAPRQRKGNAGRRRRTLQRAVCARQSALFAGGLRNKTCHSEAGGHAQRGAHAAGERVRRGSGESQENEILAQEQPRRGTDEEGDRRQEKQRPPRPRLFQHRQVHQNHLRLQRGDGKDIPGRQVQAFSLPERPRGNLQRDRQAYPARVGRRKYHAADIPPRAALGKEHRNRRAHERHQRTDQHGRNPQHDAQRLLHRCQHIQRRGAPAAISLHQPHLHAVGHIVLPIFHRRHARHRHHALHPRGLHAQQFAGLRFLGQPLRHCRQHLPHPARRPRHPLPLRRKLRGADAHPARLRAAAHGRAGAHQGRHDRAAQGGQLPQQVPRAPHHGVSRLLLRGNPRQDLPLQRRHAPRPQRQDAHGRVLAGTPRRHALLRREAHGGIPRKAAKSERLQARALRGKGIYRKLRGNKRRPQETLQSGHRAGEHDDYPQHRGRPAPPRLGTNHRQPQSPPLPAKLHRLRLQGQQMERPGRGDLLIQQKSLPAARVPGEQPHLYVQPRRHGPHRPLHAHRQGQRVRVVQMDQGGAHDVLRALQTALGLRDRKRLALQAPGRHGERRAHAADVLPTPRRHARHARCRAPLQLSAHGRLQG